MIIFLLCFIALLLIMISFQIMQLDNRQEIRHNRAMRDPERCPDCGHYDDTDCGCTCCTAGLETRS